MSSRLDASDKLTGEPLSRSGDTPPAGRALEESELEAALQLLVERAQYITGATGTALALPQGEEMVCRASAGSCAPTIGARLQVRSGLTGESIARRQLLRCDNAEADPRVNLETCRALGIASIVVLPLLRRNGEVRGLFELFSDHAYAFEERDLIALERMADLTLTALDLAEQRHGSVPPPAKQGEKLDMPAQHTPPSATTSALPESSASPPLEPLPPLAEVAPVEVARVDRPSEVSKVPAPPPAAVIELSTSSSPKTASVPESMRRVQKCESCGFPVSDGRTLCLDCEKKESEKKQNEKKISQASVAENKNEQPETPAALAPDAVLPPFLANAVPVNESWLADHVNLLAILVLIVGILVAVVVFR